MFWARKKSEPARPRRGRTGPENFKRLFVGVTGFLMAAAVYTSILIVERQDALGDVSRYNVTWLVSQASLELARLQTTVGAYAVKGSGIDAEEVQMRLDIVGNRVQLLSSGEVGEFIRSNRELEQIVEDLRTAVDATQPLIDTIMRDGSPRRVLDMLMPLNSKLA